MVHITIIYFAVIAVLLLLMFMGDHTKYLKYYPSPYGALIKWSVIIWVLAVTTNTVFGIF